MDNLRIISSDKLEATQYSAHFSDCVILTKDNKILMQQRPEDWQRYGGSLNLFGGCVEEGETIMQGLTRELHEELGAIVAPEEIIFISTLTEELSNHQEAIHIHFWHDKAGTITGCYEAEAIGYERVEEVLTHPRLMGYAAWALKECQKRGLLV